MKSLLIRWPISAGVVRFVLQLVDVSTGGDARKVDLTRNSELKKLQFFGAGPKTAVPHAEVIFAGKTFHMFMCFIHGNACHVTSGSSSTFQCEPFYSTFMSGVDGIYLSSLAA